MPGAFEDDIPGDNTDDTQLEGQQQSPSAEEAAAIAEATRKGWVSKEEFTGDKKRWVDAATFLERGERFNKNLQREVQQLKKQLETFEGTKKQFIKFHEETLAAKQSELDTAISALRVQKSQATADHEHEQAVALEDRIDLLRGQKAELTKEAAALKSDELDKPAAATEEDAEALGAARMAQNAAVQEWVEDGNEWFKDNPKLRAYAVSVTEEMLKDGEKARGRKLLDLVAERVKADFPRSFKSDAQPRNNVESGSGRGGKGPAGGKSERDLPAVDRQIMNDLIAGGYTTKENYLASYFSR